MPTPEVPRSSWPRHASGRQRTRFLKLHHVDEFLSELRHDRDVVRTKGVEVKQGFAIPDKTGRRYYSYKLYVLAHYSTTYGGLVSLGHCAGTAWHWDREAPTPTAEKIVRKIKSVCRELGLEARELPTVGAGR